MTPDASTPRRHLRSAVEWVAYHWEKSPWAFNALGGVLAMLVSLATGFDRIPGRNALTVVWAVGVVLAVVLLVIGPLLIARRAVRLKDLQATIKDLERRQKRINDARERDSADLRRVLDRVGRELLAECGVDKDDTRISIYQHHGDENKFALVGRASLNPTLSKAGRSVYHDDVGLIAKAWRERTAHDRVWYTDTDKWVDYQARTFKIDIEEARGISMKSLSYLGVRIDDDVPVGILVIESTNRERVTEEHAEQVRSHPAFGRFQLMLRAAPKLPLEEPTTS